MDAPNETAGAGPNWTVLVLVLMTLLVFVSIGLAAYLTHEPELDTPAQIEISKRDRQISRLKKEIAFLTTELLRVRTDYARLLAERRCEVIDGMDDCLAAGLERPERFRDTDAELVRQREQRQAQAKAKGTAPVTGGMSHLSELLEALPGVHTEPTRRATDGARPSR